jgi:long-chain acyl-CoA synthetase
MVTRSSLAANVEDEDFGLVAGRTIARLAKLVEAAIAPLELSLPQYRLLALLVDGAAMSSTLAERLTVKPPTVTAVVDGLVARGLVTRQVDPHDRRRLPLVLTPDGTALLEQANASVGAALVDGLGLVGDHDAHAAVDGLDAWQKVLDARRERHAAERQAAGA